jgi:hypothetical protein
MFQYVFFTAVILAQARGAAARASRYVKPGDRRNQLNHKTFFGAWEFPAG